MGFIVYILRSQRDGSLYVGQTKNLALRVARHNDGRGKTYTAKRGPWGVVHVEEHATRSEAVARERFLKSCAGSPEKKRLGGALQFG